MNYQKLLQEIGLVPKEAKIYLALLGAGPQKANFLARQTGIERANIYYHLENLREKGLVTLYTEETNTTFFKAEPAQKLLSLLETQKKKLCEKTKKVAEALPQLEQIQEGERAQSPQLRFYENKESIEELYEEMLLCRELSAITNIDRVNDFFPKYGLDFYKQTNKRKLRVKELLVNSQNAKSYKKNANDTSHKVRILPKDFKHKTDILIFGVNVAFVSYDRKPTAFVIESSEIAQAQQEIFNELWRS